MTRRAGGADRGRVASEAIRFAAKAAVDPSGVVTLWKAQTGGKAVGCLPPTPIPELLHSTGMLPLQVESPAELSRFERSVDAWLWGTGTGPSLPPSSPGPWFAFLPEEPKRLEEALDRVEALAEWAETVTGNPVSEGSLWKSIHAYAARDALLEEMDARCGRMRSFLSPSERRDIVRAGSFLPPEAHSRLLALVLGFEYECATAEGERERADPRVVLAKRLMPPAG